MREAFLAVALDHVLDDDPEEHADPRGGDERSDVGPYATHREASGFRCGKRIVSRMLAPVNSMTRRSMPSPSPPMGGAPYSSARRKSSSSCMASGSPPAALSDCSS